MNEDHPTKFWLPESAKHPRPSMNGQEAPLGDPGIRTTIIIGQKINLGGYSNSAEASIILSGVPSGATPEMIEEALDTGKIVYDKMRERLVARVEGIRKSRGFTHEYGP